MALALSLKLPLSSPRPSSSTYSKSSTPSVRLKHKSSVLCSKHLTNSIASRRGRPFATKAVEESEASTESNAAANEQQPVAESSSGELGEEIKKAMAERKAREKDGGGELLNGVAEEIGEIEWPAFGKVLGTTGVVLGVIAGSSVVLLTVNAVLAELSDRVFAGRGVQDFFS